MSAKCYGLFGLILGLMLLAGPIAGGALAAENQVGTYAGHDMSTMNQSDQMNGHDMSTMNQADQMNGHDMESMSIHSSGHGGVAKDPNTPPNWPVIYSFGALNLLVIIVASILKPSRA